MHNRVIINLNETLELIVLHTYFPYSVSFWCVLRVWRFEQRAFYINSLRVKIILACQEVLKRIWPSFKFKCHLQSWELLIVYMQNNQQKIIQDQPLINNPIDLIYNSFANEKILDPDEEQTQNSVDNKTTPTMHILGIYIWLTWSRGVIPHSPVKSWT